MNYKLLGKNTGLPVSDLALGTALFGQYFGYGAEIKEVEKIISAYIEHGGNIIDTADEYQGGESEASIGKAIGTKRNDLIIASKYSRAGGHLGSLGMVGNHRKNMVQAVEASLKRLNTDRIDLYFAHMDDQFTPMEEIVRGLDDLVRSGKIVYGGLSNFPAWRISAAATLADLRGWNAVSAIEIEYSLLQRTTEREILPMAEAYGLGVLAWSPLAGGLLTGKYRKGEKGRGTLLQGSIPYQNTEVADVVVDTLLTISKAIASDPGLIALAWLIAKGVVPILGPRTIEQLESNIKAANLQLSNEHIRQLDAASIVSMGYPHELNSAREHRLTLTAGKLDQIERPLTVVK
jgi:aryl-alcohol dehydrogenase-like predicted oxidoreductase